MPPVSKKLTSRENLCLSLMAKGLSNSEIAVMMAVSESRVKNIASSMFQKLGVDTRLKAALWWLVENSKDETIQGKEEKV